MEKIVIDVREKDEFLAERIAGSINLPLSDFDSHAASLLRYLADKPLLLMCRSGGRAELALGEIQRLGISLRTVPEVYAGGLTAWKAAGGSVLRYRARHLPVMRQVHLVAGFLVFLSALLTLTSGLYWSLLALFVGGGLMFSGVTGMCGMAMLLGKMPWNKPASCSLGCQGENGDFSMSNL